MKAILMSIQPKWCELIASGKKTLEVRKTKPKLETPFKVYIYCTKPRHYFKISKHLLVSDESLFLVNGEVRMCDGFGVEYEDREYKHLNCKVIGEFVCRNIDFLNENALFEGMDEISNSRIEEYSCLSIDELLKYKGDKEEIYGWHISDLVIYDKPKELSEFKKACPDNVYSCAMCRHSDYTGMRCTPITRPPQSWCYVEEDGKE